MAKLTAWTLWLTLFDSALENRRPGLARFIDPNELRRLYTLQHSPEAAAAHIDHITPASAQRIAQNVTAPQLAQLNLTGVRALALVRAAMDRWPEAFTDDPINAADAVDWLVQWLHQVKPLFDDTSATK